MAGPVQIVQRTGPSEKMFSFLTGNIREKTGLPSKNATFMSLNREKDVVTNGLCVFLPYPSDKMEMENNL